MNFKLYNYLRLMGVPAEEATLIASDPHVSFDIELYEAKQAVDHNRQGRYSHIVGLKEEFKCKSDM